MPSVTAIVCTYNPREDYFTRTLDGLRAQTLDRDDWELLIIDNNSDTPLDGRIDLSWHPHARIVREETPGLTHARLRSFREADTPILVYIDDDNVLEAPYLERVLQLFDAHDEVAALGGKALPEYEVDPPEWLDDAPVSLGCRDLGDEPIIASWKGLSLEERSYPKCSPIGAGLCIRREAYAAYVESASRDARRTALGRTGESLASGEDNDIVMTLLEEGWSVGYFPSLVLHHLIPKDRLTREYLERIAESSTKTWVTVLDVHGLRPWSSIPAWTVPLRKARAYVRLKPWTGDLARVRFRAACGKFEGRASLS